MAKQTIEYGPGLHQKSPTLTKRKAEDMLLEQYGTTVSKPAFKPELAESIEIGDYDFGCRGFPVWHHTGSSFPAKYLLEYEIPKSGPQPWVLLDATGGKVDSYTPTLAKPRKGFL